MKFRTIALGLTSALLAASPALAGLTHGPVLGADRGGMGLRIGHHHKQHLGDMHRAQRPPHPARAAPH